MNTFTELEGEDVRHGEDEERREELVVDPTFEVILPSDLKKAPLVKILCSCGSSKCFAIGRFGLPAPTYHTEIAPLGQQTVRDQRAIALRQALG